MKNTSNQYVIGVWYTAIAYMIWGFLPLYWKKVDSVVALEILAHRILWSLVFVLLILLFSSKWELVKSECRMLVSSRKQFFVVFAGSLLISANWLIYIWAVNADFVIEASLGYYINPLLSVLLGIIVLKERLTFWQTLSFGLAAIGVSILTLKYGKVPWIAISLALSFALYGLIKKQSKFNSLIGLAFETLFVAPIALIYLGVVHLQGNGAFLSLSSDVKILILLMGAGIATALPLLLFAVGAKRIPLSMVGFLQYIAPTISLGLGVFVFKETFSVVHFISFSFIWTALTVYSLSKTRLFTTIEEKLFRNNRFEM